MIFFPQSSAVSAARPDVDAPPASARQQLDVPSIPLGEGTGTPTVLSAPLAVAQHQHSPSTAFNPCSPAVAMESSLSPPALPQTLLPALPLAISPFQLEILLLFPVQRLWESFSSLDFLTLPAGTVQIHLCFSQTCQISSSPIPSPTSCQVPSCPLAARSQGWGPFSLGEGVHLWPRAEFPSFPLKKPRARPSGQPGEHPRLLPALPSRAGGFFLESLF